MREHSVTGGGGRKLHVVEGGDPDGPPLLFLHGWSQCWLAWRAQFRSDLAADFRLVAWDMRGHGRSDKPDDEYGDSQLWAADLHAVITELALHRPVVTGWSYGGLVICDYLRVHGEAALGGIHLVGAISELGSKTAAESVGADFLAAARGSYSTDLAECLAGIDAYLQVVTGYPLSDEDYAVLFGYNAMVPPHVRKRLFTRKVTGEDELRAVTVPVLITHGEQDRVVLPVAADRHAALIAHAAQSRYPDTGHAPFAQEPDRFNRELREFATECGSRFVSP